jgi:lactate dehydrogenase-like 2-hydroxyacid dehydrogenase
MDYDKPDILLIGPAKPTIVEGLAGSVTLHVTANARDSISFLDAVGQRIRAIVVPYVSCPVDQTLMQALPRLELISTFGVGYDHIDIKFAAERGVIVTNTPDVLNEEVADTALALLLSTVRELSSAERYLRAGKWLDKPFHLSRGTLRDRTVGMIGLGRIGKAIARRLDAFGVPVVYHSRRPQDGVHYKYYSTLLEMAHDVDTLIVMVPGGDETKNLVDMRVLKALGPRGVLINAARGSTVNEEDLIRALQNGTIFSAGLDVYTHEPNVPPDLIALENVVLLPHVGTRSAYTHGAMDQLVVDNILSWMAGRGPLTPVSETPYTLT